MKRDDVGVGGGENEGEFYRRIIRRAKRVRERAADSLRRSHVLGTGQADAGSPLTPLQSGEGFGARGLTKPGAGTGAGSSA